jgi:hypothetical protein
MEVQNLKGNWIKLQNREKYNAKAELQNFDLGN